MVRQLDNRAGPQGRLECGQDPRHEPRRRPRNRQQDQPRQPPRRCPVRAEPGERQVGQRCLHAKQQVAMPQPHRPGRRDHVQQWQDGQRRDHRHLAEAVAGGAVSRFGHSDQAHDHGDQRCGPPHRRLVSGADRPCAGRSGQGCHRACLALSCYAVRLIADVRAGQGKLPRRAFCMAGAWEAHVQLLVGSCQTGTRGTAEPGQPGRKLEP
jgi:hypothetical protein